MGQSLSTILLTKIIPSTFKSNLFFVYNLKIKENKLKMSVITQRENLSKKYIIKSFKDKKLIFISALHEIPVSIRNLLISFKISHGDFLKKITNEEHDRRSSWDLIRLESFWDLVKFFFKTKISERL